MVMVVLTVLDRVSVFERWAERGRAPELAGDVHDSSLAFTPFPVQGLRWSPGSFQVISTTSISLFSQVSDVYTSQSQCDTAVDLVRSRCLPG